MRPGSSKNRPSSSWVVGANRKNAHTLAPAATTRLDLHLRHARIKLPPLAVRPFDTLNRYDALLDSDAFEIGRVPPVTEKRSTHGNQLKTYEGKHHPQPENGKAQTECQTRQLPTTQRQPPADADQPSNFA
jgi:hypothetical protein